MHSKSLLMIQHTRQQHDFLIEAQAKGLDLLKASRLVPTVPQQLANFTSQYQPSEAQAAAAIALTHLSNSESEQKQSSSSGDV